MVNVIDFVFLSLVIILFFILLYNWGIIFFEKYFFVGKEYFGFNFLMNLWKCKLLMIDSGFKFLVINILIFLFNVFVFWELNEYFVEFNFVRRNCLFIVRRCDVSIFIFFVLLLVLLVMEWDEDEIDMWCLLMCFCIFVVFLLYFKCVLYNLYIIFDLFVLCYLLFL